MELKRQNMSQDETEVPLLIVPYGIETKIMREHDIPMQLLIVPYGIETMLG